MLSDSSASVPKVHTLQAQIDDLGALYHQVQSLRLIPALLLQGNKPSGQTQSEFERLKQIGDSIHSAPVQEALHQAEQSLGVDATEINSNPRREIRKKR